MEYVMRDLRNEADELRRPGDGAGGCDDAASLEVGAPVGDMDRE